MDSYHSLGAWKLAHQALITTLRATDQAFHPRAMALFDQIRRAAISVEANIVEGYALNTAPLCRRHLRIAFGSAAEAECLIRAAAEIGYLKKEIGSQIEQIIGGTMRALRGLMRSPPVTVS